MTYNMSYLAGKASRVTPGWFGRKTNFRKMLNLQ